MTTDPGRFIAAISASAAMLVGCGGGSSADTPITPANATFSCSALSGKLVSGSVALNAVAVAPSGVVPAYCKVNGTIAPSLNFEVRLPLAWNGKLHYGGGGGYDGSIPTLSGANLVALIEGYATVSSDSGHQASGVDASFALTNATAARLFGGDAIPLVDAAALAIVQLAFGSAPSKSYFQGCSNGGREALVGAQRYPQLFDGVIAQAPAYNWTGLIGAFNRNAIALAQPGGQIPSAKAQLLARAVLAACDSLDGLADGVTSNQAACTSAFRVASLRCTNGVDAGNSCFSDAQLAAVASLTSAASFAGSVPYTNQGWNITGGEDDPGAWIAALTGDGNFVAGQQFLYQDTTVKNYLAKNPAANSIAYAPYNQNPSALNAMAALNDATSTDLSAFNGRGAKLILWQGGNDFLVSPNNTTAYYNGVVNASGGQAPADLFVRYYTAPGVDHCGGGPGADSVDLLAALDNWVANGVAPDSLIAAKLGADGSAALTRPLCRYPKYPRYTGPANDAAAAKLAQNFSCVSP